MEDIRVAGDGWMKLHPFSEVITDVTSKFRKIKASEYKAEGRFKIIDQGQKEIAGYTDDESLINKTHSPIIVFGDHTRALKYEESPIVLGADGAKALAINPKLANALYIFYYLRSINLKEAGYSRHFKFLKQVEIPIPEKDGKPNLDDQKRIAHLLGKVEGLIARRKQHLQQLDDLLKSVFLEMFGDPIVNPRKFPVRKLSEFYINPKEGTKCGPFGSALKKEEFVDSGVPVWNMDNIDPAGRMVLPFRLWITEEKYKKLSSYSVIDGDIIISRAGTVGKMCVARMNGDEAAIISTNLIRLRLGNKLRSLHVVSLMTYCKGRVGRLKTGADGAFTHMNTGILDNLEFPYPPIELQDQFTIIVEKVKMIESRYQQSLIDLESLYGALSQKAFKGELDLSRVSLLNIQTLLIDDELAHDFIDLSQPKDDKLDSVNKTDTDQTDFFNTWTFHEFLRTRKDEVLTATDLWEELQRNNFKNPPPSFGRFKTWILTCLEQGKWMEQVYGEVYVDKNSNAKEKKIALRIRDDS